MSSVVLTQNWQAVVAATLAAQWAAYVGGARTKVHLFQNNIVPQFNTVATDFVEADFVGYAAVLTALWAFAINQEGNSEVYWNDVPATFTAGAIVGPQTIYGYWMDSTTDGLIIAERFDTPITLAAALEYLQVLPRVSVTGIGGTGNIND